MTSTGFVKRLLISSAVLSGLFLVGAKQASADTVTDDTTATTSATTTTSNQSTKSTTLRTTTDSSTNSTPSATTTSNRSATASNSETATSTDAVTTPTNETSAADTTAPSTEPTTTPDTNQPQSSTTTEASSSAVKSATTPTVSYKTARAAVNASVVQADLQLTPAADTIQSGETATFDLNLAISGIDKTTTQQHVIIDLPTNFTLPADTDLTIDGVTPTLSETGTQLIYDFDTPTNGLSISKKYNFATDDQPILNGTKISMAASYFDDDQQLATSGPQTVIITTKPVYGVTNELIGVLPHDADGNLLIDENGNSTIDKTKMTGIAGDYLAYQIGISAPKQLLGQAYFDPDTPIDLVYLLPKGLSFDRIDTVTQSKATYKYGVDPDTGQTVIEFTIPAPTLAEQQAASDNLFADYFNLVAKIDADAPAGTELTTVSQLQATTIDGTTVMSDVATSTITTAMDLALPYIPTDGSQLYQYSWGPADGNGNLAGSKDNVDPQVTPDANLAYKVLTGPANFFGVFQSKMNPIIKYTVTYNVDPHLNVNNLKIYHLKSYLADNYYAPNITPKLNVYVRYQDETNFEETPVYTQETINDSPVLDMNTLIDNERGVAQLQFDYTNIPVKFSTSMDFNMSPKAGYYGTVSNDFTVEEAGWTSMGWIDILYSKDGAYVQSLVPDSPSGTPLVKVGQEVHLVNGSQPIEPGSAGDHREAYNRYMQPKTAEIVKPAENTPRVLNETLDFANQTNGFVSTGDSVLHVMVENNKASLQAFSDLKSILILPASVTYTGNDPEVTATAQTDGSTQLTINWTRTNLAPTNQNKLDLAINIDAGLSLGTITPILYSTVKETDTVTPGTIDPASASDVQAVADNDDLDADATTTTLFQLRKSFATTVDSHQIHAAATATNLAGDTGDLVKVQAGQAAHFGLSLTPASDGALQNVKIIGTLPALNDTAILDSDVNRGTTMPVTLTGAITLPDGWQAATVTYALASDPTTYVAATDVPDFGQVVGFKLTYNGDNYLPSDVQQLAIPVKVDAKATLGQTAYISYSISANGLNPTEGLKAGFQVELGPAGIPGGGIWVKTQVPEGVFVTPEDYYDNTKPPTDPVGPTEPTTPVTPPATPTAPTTPTDTPTEPTITDEIPVNTIATPTTPAAQDNTTVEETQPAQAANATSPTATSVQSATVAIGTTANDPRQSSATTTTPSATLPQTDDAQAPATTSLVGLLIATLLSLFGLGHRRRHE